MHVLTGKHHKSTMYFNCQYNFSLTICLKSANNERNLMQAITLIFCSYALTYLVTHAPHWIVPSKVSKCYVFNSENVGVIASQFILLLRMSQHATVLHE
jgi:hypothetical protein